MARVAEAGFAIPLGLALGIGIEPAQATEQPRELEASLVVDLDDDDADGLAVGDYESFGPVALFRDSFLDAWNRALARVAARRAELNR